MPRFLTDHEYRVVSAAADRLLPPLDAHPGGAALGVADYVDNLRALSARDLDTLAKILRKVVPEGHTHP